MMKPSKFSAVSLCGMPPEPSGEGIVSSQSSSHFTSARKSGSAPPCSGIGSDSVETTGWNCSHAASIMPAENVPLVVYLP